MNLNMKKDLSNYTLLFVENEEGIRNNLKEIFEHLFDKVYIANDGLEGYEKYIEHKPNFIITDIKMPVLNGLEMITKIRANDLDTEIAVISAYTDINYLLNSIELNLLKYIIKPITETKLTNLFKTFLNKKASKNIIKLKNDYLYDRSFNKIKNGDEEYLLSKKEALFLNYLIDKDAIVSYSEIEDLLWEDKSMSLNALRLFIKNFRKKLPDDFLVNLQNQGYTLSKD